MRKLSKEWIGIGSLVALAALGNFWLAAGGSSPWSWIVGGIVLVFGLAMIARGWGTRNEEDT